MCEVGGARWSFVTCVFFVFYRVFVGFYQDISEGQRKAHGSFPVFLFGAQCCGWGLLQAGVGACALPLREESVLNLHSAVQKLNKCTFSHFVISVFHFYSLESVALPPFVIKGSICYVSPHSSI